MKKTQLITALASAAALALPAAAGAATGPCSTDTVAPGGDWPLYGRNVINSRSQPKEKTIGTKTVAKLGLAWIGAGNSGNGTPVVKGNCIYVTGADGMVRALDAGTGQLVWQASTAVRDGEAAGQLYGLSVYQGLVHVNVQYLDFPRSLAFDADTGRRVWTGSPIQFGYTAWQISTAQEFDGMVFQGTTGPDADPKARPGYALLDAATGAVLHKQSTIPTTDLDDGYSGGGIWSTPAVDRTKKYLYVGTANPYSKKIEHAYDNAILKIDVDRSRPTFGRIVASFKGSTDQFVEGLNKQPACDNFGELPVSYHPSGFSIACFQLDVDFAASAQLVKTTKGRQLVVEEQKSGVLHALDADTMQPVWNTTVGTLPPETSGNAASTATDGKRIFVSGMPSLLSAVTIDTGKIAWTLPISSAAYHPLVYANGVVYAFGNTGEFLAVDAKKGTLLWQTRPDLDAQTVCSTVLTSGGVVVAHNTVYVNCDGTLLAYRLGASGAQPPGGGGGLPELPVPSPEPPGGGGGDGLTLGAIIAAPVGASTGYATPYSVTTAGSGVTFINADPTAQHNVTATGTGADGQPLFRSANAAAGGTAAVKGASKLGAGSYGFLCSIHPNMHGTLVVR